LPELLGVFSRRKQRIHSLRVDRRAAINKLPAPLSGDIDRTTRLRNSRRSLHAWKNLEKQFTPLEKLKLKKCDARRFSITN
jgi:hypothetical protein